MIALREMKKGQKVMYIAGWGLNQNVAMVKITKVGNPSAMVKVTKIVKGSDVNPIPEGKEIVASPHELYTY